MITAIKYARENKVPFLGICLGMQMCVIEFARDVLKLEDVNSEEFEPNAKNLGNTHNGRTKENKQKRWHNEAWRLSLQISSKKQSNENV